MKKTKEPKYASFICCDTILEANGVNLDRYTFLERMSAKTGKWCFKIRERVRENELLQNIF